jgi:3-oxoacyl-[acyl-carrier-protein] synthase-3
MATPYRSRVLGIGSYLPERVVTNDDLAQWMETSNEWIIERTGIEERRWVDPETGEGGAELAANACKEALEAAGVEAGEVDMLIYATLSPDIFFPGTGCLTQRLLGMRENAILDIRQQCTGFVYGLSIADQFIRTGMYEKILVVGSEVHSTGLDVSTAGRDVTVLFGDGAGAMLLGRADGEDHMLLSTHLHADGADAEILWTPKPGSRFHPRLTAADLEEGLHYPKMEGRKVFKHAVTRMPEAILEGMKANGLGAEDIDMVIPHQANLRINEFVAKSLKLGPDKVHNTIQWTGNTTAASIPICTHDAIKKGKISDGDLVCMVAFGAGLTWGSAFIRW